MRHFHRAAGALALLFPIAAAATPVAVPEPAPAPVATPEVAPTPAAPMAAAPITCIEVDRLRVPEEQVEGQSEREAERAARIAPEKVDIILQRTVAHARAKLKGFTVVTAGAESCPDPAAAAVLRADLLDYKKGNRAVRYLVGFGAGKQKVKVRSSLVRKADGSVIAEEEIADAKWGGAFGGSGEKGLDDFAQELAQFAAKTLLPTK